MKKICLSMFLIIGLFSLLSAKRTRQIGKGSYYADAFHGRRTANGEKYNKYDLTCAHKSLPFNTLIRVTNYKTKKSVVVRVNDRGPFCHGRVIDISKAAAKKIGLIQQGVGYLKVESFAQQSAKDSSELFNHHLDLISTNQLLNMRGKPAKPRGYGFAVVEASLDSCLAEAKKYESEFHSHIYIKCVKKDSYQLFVGQYPTLKKIKRKFDNKESLNRTLSIIDYKNLNVL